jgi:hypothetical protein
MIHCKERLAVFPSPAGMSLTWTGIIKFFLARESLVSDVPAGDERTANLFLQCKEQGEGYESKKDPRIYQDRSMELCTTADGSWNVENVGM